MVPYCYFCHMTVSHFIADQPEPQRTIMTVLRSWILDLGPHTTEKISYKVPFFYFYGPICYLSFDGEGVSLSFTKGFELSRDHALLESKGRKQVRSITFFSIAEIEEHEDSVRQILNEAAILNEYQFKRNKKRK